MARRRVLVPPGYLVNTRGHSVLKKKTYGMPSIRSETIYTRPSRYDLSYDDSISDSVSRAGYLSNAVLDDASDEAAKSRNRDHALLRSANAAILNTEQHSSPRVAVISRRVRASTAPPPTRPPVAQEAAVYKVDQAARASTPIRVGGSYYIMAPHVPYVPPPPQVKFITVPEAPWIARAHERAAAGRGGRRYPRSHAARVALARPVETVQALPTAVLCAHRPKILRKDIMRSVRARSLEPPRTFYYDDYFDEEYEPEEKGEGKRRIEALPSSVLWAHRPVPLKKDVIRLARARSLERPVRVMVVRGGSEPREVGSRIRVPLYHPLSIPDVRMRALARYLYAPYIYRGWSRVPESLGLVANRSPLRDFPLVYVPWTGQGPSNRAKAAIIGSKLEAEKGGGSKRKPRSQYAIDKYRSLRTGDDRTAKEGIYTSSQSSSALHASKPPLPKLTERKAIRDVDGYTSPRNLMSWQYRVESRLNPDDLIYQPSSFIRMREQVRDAQEKMDRHRQLLDRYLVDSDTGEDIATTVLRKSGSGTTDSYGGHTVSSGGDPNARPVSELRRKIRRKICQAKNNPHYYRD